MSLIYLLKFETKMTDYLLLIYFYFISHNLFGLIDLQSVQ